MPAVREVSPDEEPQKLEVVEVRPGVFLKLNAADRAAFAPAAPVAEVPKPTKQRPRKG